MDAKVARSLWYWVKVRFNPRARDGREGMNDPKSFEHVVSIHAPVMDAKVSFMGL